jgi:ABC-type transport system involved in multi-copper enzyme maturation permease subunit
MKAETSPATSQKTLGRTGFGQKIAVVLSIAKTTVEEAIRRRVLLVILLIGILFLVVAPGLNVLTARTQAAILSSFLLGILQLTGALIAIVLTVYLIPNEIERRTIYTILCKPVQRWQFLIGKYLGAVFALGMMMALMTVVMLLIFWLQSTQGLDFPPSRMMETVQVCAMYFVQMSLLAAVAMFFSTFVTPLVNFFLSGGVYLVGTLFNPYFDSISRAEGASAFAKAGATVVGTVIPNFANFNVQNTVINPGAEIANPTWYYVQITLYGLFYISILLVAAILIFDRREL